MSNGQSHWRTRLGEHIPIDVAMEILVDAEAEFPREPAIPYNLACYYCHLEKWKKPDAI